MTSSHVPAREPAWAGEQGPGTAAFEHPVAPEVAAWLAGTLRRRYFSDVVEPLGSLRSTCGRHGHVLVAADGGRWVAHVKTTAGDEDIEVAAAVARHLQAHGVHVNAYLAHDGGRHELHVDGMWVTVTAFTVARHTRYTLADADGVGRQLAAAHAALLTFAGAERVRERAQGVIEQLSSWREALTAGAWRTLPQAWRTVVRDAAAAYDPQFSGAGASQCGHGDLSPGNVLFTAGGQVVLCDFEDSAFCYRPPAFDLGMATLRFGLEGGRGADGSTPRERAQALLDGYAAMDHGARPGSAAVQASVGNLSRHFLTLLGGLTLGGSSIDDGEWRKAAGWAALADTLA